MRGRRGRGEGTGTKARERRTGRAALGVLALAALLTAALALSGSALSGQDVEQRLPGVRLGLVYETAYTPALAIQPFTGRFGGDAAASRVEAIIGRDLRNSDRFEVMDSLPDALAPEQGVDYALWDNLGAVWLLTGTVEGSGDGYVLVLEAHDVLYRQVAHSGTFRIPDPNSPDFRMAVHRASDEIVEWIFDEPGMAASRITFSMLRPDGTREIYVIDSDGENLRRVSDMGDIALSPTWSPDGERVAYMSYNDDGQRIFESVVSSGETRLIEPVNEGNYITPEYHPDGRRIAFHWSRGERTGIYLWDLEQDCCLTNVTEGRWEDLNPSFSPDGSRLVFNSNRLGSTIPQIYSVPTSGGQPELLSPYAYGSRGYFTAPDWAPFGDNVAFSGRVERSGRFNILVARMGRGNELVQLTREGVNEDPSWAPDGRHIVFAGEHEYGLGLYVVDTASGRRRALLRGVDVGQPDWSPGM